MIRATIITSGAVVMASPGGFTLDINTVLTALGVGGGAAAIWKIVGLVLDKVVPSRSDKRSEVETSLTVLSRTIEILANEKAHDAKDLAEAKIRIRTLEESGASDYDLIRALRQQVDDLERRIARKDESIAQLTRELGEYGARVVFDGLGHLHVDATRAHASTGPIPTAH